MGEQCVQERTQYRKEPCEVQVFKVKNNVLDPECRRHVATIQSHTEHLIRGTEVCGPVHFITAASVVNASKWL